MNRIRQALRDLRGMLPLLQNLVGRELKKKYRRNILGYLWGVLNPLLVMLIMTAVFSTMFHNNIENYPVYLFTGRMFFSFITESTNSVSRSIISNGTLMRKTRIPYYVFPLANFLSSVVNFCFTLVAFVLVLLFTQTTVSVHILALPVVIAQVFVFSFGLGLFLAQANVFVRDAGYLYSVWTTAWMYLTPLFYPITTLPEGIANGIMNWNPAYFFVTQGREIILAHQWPDGMLVLKGSLVAAGFFLIGVLAYRRARDRMILFV